MTAQEQPATRTVPAETGFWFFVLGDLASFGVFFVLWGWSTAQHPAEFAAGHAEMNQTLGLVNTLVLITGSGLAVAGLQLARLGRYADASRAYAATATTGVLFALVKGVEYLQHLTSGTVTDHDEYYAYYFVFTGIHLLHVGVGVLATGWAAWRCRQQRADRDDLPFLEGAGIYWHLVDVVWLVLFFLIYLAH